MRTVHLSPSMHRRRWILSSALEAALAVAASGGFAQSSRRARIPTVGVLWHAGSREEEGKYFDALLEGFRDLGYVDGQNIALEHRYPNEQYERFDSFATDLVERKPDLLIGVTQRAAMALQRTGTSIPIVFLIVPDPVAARLVNSLASPGSNITGLSSISTDLSAKRLQMFKQAIPSLARLGLMVNPRDKLISARTLSEMQAAGAELKLDIVPVEAQEASDMETAIERASRTRIDGLVAAQDPVFFAARHQIAQLALAHRLPSNCFNSDMVAAGFLMSYGVNSPAMFRRTPLFVDRILKGAKPQDIPVEQPTLFEATVNLRTARALGLKLSQSVLLQAQHLFD